jgi:hypothetical protein
VAERVADGLMAHRHCSGRLVIGTNGDDKHYSHRGKRVGHDSRALADPKQDFITIYRTLAAAPLDI